MRAPTPDSPPDLHPGHAPLTLWQQLALGSLLVLLLVFGVLVEIRSAFLSRPMTDLQVYLRAAWAVRNGTDLYAITDDNDWHYHYPPLLAILLVPLADAPPAASQAGLVPFAVSVALWYLFGVACLIWAVHAVANALEERAAVPVPRGCQRWWALRLLPVLACLAPIGLTLSRGQVNLLLLALLGGIAAATLRKRPWRAGLWLAAAICLKIIPAFLIVYPLWRRDWRSLGGCGVGLVVGLVVIPGAVFGPRQTVAYFREWAEVLLLPGTGQGDNQSRAKELIEITATDSQSILAIVHNTRHPEPATRPGQPSREDRLLHWFLGAGLTVLTLLTAGRRRYKDGTGALIFLGMLILIMLFLSPVCHLHYFCLAVPLIMGFLERAWQRGAYPHLGGALVLLLVINTAGNIVPHLPGFQAARDLGMASYATLLLWLGGMVTLWRRVPGARSVTQPLVPELAA